MCRSIKTLFNFEPPATDEEIRSASLQFVRKLAGFSAPSKPNQIVFDRSVADVYKVARRLIDSMTTTAPPRDREIEAAKAKERAAIRFGTKPAPRAKRARATATR
jgi:hypothetical protein